MKIKTYMPMVRVVIMALIMFSFSTVFSQRSISGSVIDNEGLELAGANIVVEGTVIGTTADISGEFTLEIPEDAKNLIVSYTGYKKLTVAITSESRYDLVMEEDFSLLNEVVVLGYGRTKKSVLTGAISSIGSKEIATLSSPQLETAIQGQIAGVNILPSSGSPGAPVKVRIRGTGSNGNSDPLYIVDGMRTRDISFVESEEIENIEVLKDAASAAIYGAEGANGVVIISTKAGKLERPSVTYTAQFGNQSFNTNLRLMDAQQHAEYVDEAGIVGRTPADVEGLPTTDWIKESFEDALLQRHALSFTGGSENMSYFVKGGFVDQGGIVVGDKDRFKRYSVRANINSQVKSWLRIDGRLSYTNKNTKGITEDSEFGGILSNSILMDPATPITYTGELPTFVQDLIDGGSTLLKDENGNYYGLSEFVNGEIYNPYAAVDVIRGSGTTSDRVFGSVAPEFTLAPGLTFTSRLGINNEFGKFHVWAPSFYFTATRQSNEATVQETQFRNTDLQWENFINYEKSFGVHNLSLIGGTSIYETMNSWLTGAGTGLILETEPFATLGGVQPGAEFTTSSGGITRTTLASFFGRVSYNFDERYLFSATLRRDGSSLLAEGKKWGMFPSASAGWVVSKENFFPENDILNFIKLRISWGQNGSLSNLSPGAWRSAIGFGNAYPDADGNLQITAEPTVLSNIFLTWETSEQIDFGIDLGLFEDRLNITFDYFDKTTKDLLNTGVIPGFIGNSAPIVNLGDISNKGIELEINYKNKVGDLGYEIAANYTAIKNEVTRLDENLDFATGVSVGVGWTATAFEEGQPAWYFRGYQTDGIFQDQAEIDAYTASTTIDPLPVPGDPKVVDVNGDGEITPDDQTKIGSPYPTASYGVRIALDYKGFDFGLFLRGTTGNQILLGYNRTDRATSNKPLFFYEDRWTTSNATNDWFRANGDNIYAYNSDFMVFDGSFMRIKQLQLGYTIPKSVTPVLKNARFYVSLEDFFTFTKYPGLDPEAGSNNDQSLGIDRGVYPTPKKLLFGLSVKF